VSSLRFKPSRDTSIVAAFIALAWLLRLQERVSEPLNLWAMPFALFIFAFALRGFRQVLTRVNIREGELEVKAPFGERVVPLADVRSWSVDVQGLVTLRGPFGQVFHFETAALEGRGTLLARLAARLGAPELARVEPGLKSTLFLSALFAAYLAAEWERYRHVLPSWVLGSALISALVAAGLAAFKKSSPVEQRFIPDVRSQFWLYLMGPFAAAAAGSADGAVSRVESIFTSLLVGVVLGGVAGAAASRFWRQRGVQQRYVLNTRD
jgi:hypothetical protein